MTWNPNMDEAPRDGTYIWAGTACSWMQFLYVTYPMKQYWDGEFWVADDGRSYEPQPTHWKSLDPSPVPHRKHTALK